MSRQPRSRHYSPALDREVVRVLYHEAKRRRQPMTRLANAIIAEALQGSEGWKKPGEAEPPPNGGS